jgi:uncharacterized phage-like protein YoqJ
MVTGHRPPKIGGYDPNHPLRRAVCHALRTTLIDLTARPGVDALGGNDTMNPICISGMALGVDQDFATIALNLGCVVHAYCPTNQNNRWPVEARQAYHELLQRITEEGKHGDRIHILIQEEGESYAQMLQRRNEAMVNAADHIIAVWDGSSGGTANCLRYAQSIGRPAPTLIDPRNLA